MDQPYKNDASTGSLILIWIKKLRGLTTEGLKMKTFLFYFKNHSWHFHLKFRQKGLFEKGKSKTWFENIKIVKK